VLGGHVISEQHSFPNVRLQVEAELAAKRERAGRAYDQCTALFAKRATAGGS
jgi:hypothetical protein